VQRAPGFSLRPPFIWADEFAKLGRSVSRERKVVSFVMTGIGESVFSKWIATILDVVPAWRAIARQAVTTLVIRMLVALDWLANTTPLSVHPATATR
jgi:hypothetical protein